MIDQALLYTSYIGTILLIGLLCSIISRKLRINTALLLIGVGMAIGYLLYDGKPIIEFSPSVLASLAVITLALVVFDSSSRFKFREFDTLSFSAIKISLIFFVLNMALLAVAAHYLFSVSVLLSLLFAAVVSGTGPALMMFSRSKVFELLKVESIFNIPFTILISFLLIDLIKNTENNGSFGFLSGQAFPFAQQFVAGIGTGLLISFVFFGFMKKYYSRTLSPLAIITAALVTYIIAEILGGSGVLAVTTAGIFFGNVYHIKHIRKLQEFGRTFSEVLEILVFVLIGSIIKIPWTSSFLIPALLLFLMYLVIRFLSVEFVLMRSGYSFKEKLFLTLNIPKGLAAAVVVFTLITRAVAGASLVLDLIFLFMISSIVLSTIVTHFSKFFTKIDILPREEE